MDMATVFLASFFTSIVAFSYLAYKLYKKSAELWVHVGRVIWVVLGVFHFLAGFHSGNIITMVMGLALAFASASFFFTYYVKRELGVKKFLEVIFGAVSFGVIIYGYIITESSILEIATLFIAAMILIAFMLSYFLPRIQAKIKMPKQ